jgi:small basic protein (TIGR04137 family)
MNDPDHNRRFPVGRSGDSGIVQNRHTIDRPAEKERHPCSVMGNALHSATRIFETTEVIDMSMDRSLKAGAGLVRHRNVLTRGERISRLEADGKWDESKPVTGLVKVGNRKLIIGGKAEKKDDAAATTAKGAAAPAAKGAAAPAAKGAAAPAAKGAKK